MTGCVVGGGDGSAKTGWPIMDIGITDSYGITAQAQVTMWASYSGGSNDGSMKTGWQKVNGNWYYLMDLVLHLQAGSRLVAPGNYLKMTMFVSGTAPKEIAGSTFYVFNADGVIMMTKSFYLKARSTLHMHLAQQVRGSSE